MLDIILLYLLYAYIALLGYYLFTWYAPCAVCTPCEQQTCNKRNHDNDDRCNKKLKIE